MFFYLCNYEIGKMLPLQCFLGPCLKCIAFYPAALGSLRQLLQLPSGLAQGNGNSSLLSAQQFFTLDYHKRPVQITHGIRNRAARTFPSFLPSVSWRPGQPHAPAPSLRLYGSKEAK
jgi:hypothetical protein